ncbi:GAF and ANTAR domain-containing protein [Cryptosporangium minutisporangium]|uniref:GAF and ANTAR domain-containing protein n=1 Tax=Cryptosporangium minutisporangium TaxID=113569 RepID=A0ABP6SZD8_9ACTN
MTTETHAPDRSSGSGPLARSLVKLAGTPDDASDLDAQLVAIAQLAVECLPAVAYSSTTALREKAYTTVAATSALAAAVDDAQYDARSGPCLEALESGAPVAVPDMATTMQWPGFRRTARRLGLDASLSIPLFAGRGDAVASMNLYSRDKTAMADVAAHVRAAFGTGDSAPPKRRHTARPPATGADELAAGLVEALAVRDRIQLAIGMVAGRARCTATDAYVSLRVRAAEAGVPLLEIATRTLRRLP